MDKLALLRRRVVRGLIAGLFAWALVLQGAALAASAQGAAPAGLSSAHFELCSADKDGHEPSHQRHQSCSCCLPSRSSQWLFLAALGPPPLPAQEFFVAAAGSARPRPSVVARAFPPGWLGSWSQRAPPRRS
jgi:hypothetical protein